MNVLICNNDPAVASVVRRTLRHKLNYGVIEAANGLDVITVLQQQSIDGLILEVQMPVMGGLEALQVLRDSPLYAKLPVVVLATEADETIASRFIALGVQDIVLQSVGPGRLSTRIETAFRGLTAYRGVDLHGNRRTGAGLSPSLRVLMMDGDAEYRQYFKKVVAGRFEMIDAESGAQGLMACHTSPPDAVVVGIQLGLVTHEHIVRRLRAVPGKTIQLIAIPLRSESAAIRESGLYDSVFTRTYISATLEKDLAKLLQPASPFALLSQVVPDIRTQVIAAAEQVLGIMLMTDVEPAEVLAVVSEPRACAAIEITTAAFVATVRIRFDFASGREVAAAFLETDAAGLADDDVMSVAGEVVNALVGPLKTEFMERGLEATIGLPVLTTEPAGDQRGLAAQDSGTSFYFRAVDRPVTFQIDLSAERLSSPLENVCR
jgi:CheY-like chemotaxis protein